MSLKNSRGIYRIIAKNLSLVAVLLIASMGSAAAQTHCSRETLSVHGTPVSISYCLVGAPVALGGGEVSLAVRGSYSAPGGAFSDSQTLRFISGEGPSRVLSQVALAELGLVGTLHMTLVYGGDGAVHIEHAMLTPGAITIK